MFNIYNEKYTYILFKNKALNKSHLIIILSFLHISNATDFSFFNLLILMWKIYFINIIKKIYMYFIQKQNFQQISLDGLYMLPMRKKEKGREGKGGATNLLHTFSNS